uniref:Uncharacterized protein n=1 Tax=Aegilops tauschii subsp. strangulata TaxID=200361 RepID=A0A453S9H0_AEGTS
MPLSIQSLYLHINYAKMYLCNNNSTKLITFICINVGVDVHIIAIKFILGI